MGQALGICCLLCYEHCNIPDVVDDISLFPPCPAFYFSSSVDNGAMVYYSSSGAFAPFPDCITYKELDIDDDTKIAVAHYKSASSKRVLIYSHGNALDIGGYIEEVCVLGAALDSDYILYDYEGYGLSSGVPHGYNLPRDLRAVYDYARQFFDGKDIYFVGESIGSVPTCYVANSLYEENTDVPLAGVILHAALYSGSSFPCGCLIHSSDPYNNAKMIRGVKCPIFHIHGMLDEIVPYKLGSKLYDISKSEFEPWWLKDCHHTDIIILHQGEYINKMKQFFAFCEEKLVPKE